MPPVRGRVLIAIPVVAPTTLKARGARSKSQEGRQPTGAPSPKIRPVGWPSYLAMFACRIGDSLEIQVSQLSQSRWNVLAIAMFFFWRRVGLAPKEGAEALKPRTEVGVVNREGEPHHARGAGPERITGNHGDAAFNEKTLGEYERTLRFVTDTD